MATDLDGTLLRSDGTVSDRSRRALRAAEAAGLLVVLVTGRPPRWMPEITRATGRTGLAVCANGALLYDLRTETVVRQRLLDPGTLAAVVARLRRIGVDLAFALDYGMDFAQEPGYQHGWDIGSLALRIAPVADLIDRPAAKLLARPASPAGPPWPGPAASGRPPGQDEPDPGRPGSGLPAGGGPPGQDEAATCRPGSDSAAGRRPPDPDALLAAAVAAVGELATVTSSSPGLLEVSAAGVTKASALADLAAAAGVPASAAVAFGDMPNDLAMLTWAGRAVAVANAHPSVLAVADEVTASNDEDGVARVLERLLPSDHSP